MANKLRGEVSFEAEEKEYVLRCGAKEAMGAETELGIKDPFANMGEMSVGQLVTLFRHLLSNKHPDLAQDRAADLMTEAGGFGAVAEMMGRSHRLVAGLSEYPTDEEKTTLTAKAKAIADFAGAITAAVGLEAEEVRRLEALHLGSLSVDGTGPGTRPKAPAAPGPIGLRSEPAASAQG